MIGLVPRDEVVLAVLRELEAELHTLRPRCVVCLGGTAAAALLGAQTRVMQVRGRVMTHTAWAPAVVVTVHPAAVLRADDGGAYFDLLASDLQLAAEWTSATSTHPDSPPL